ncbi:MAG TPA: type VI secretion system tip protein TssI/VgrG, partial [Polyangiaceae bacterium]|nr:type VI secretion system tip protein TssI/VgrG [Polyangiaceae bacterium]
RIFQEKSVPEVLDLVLGPALEPYGRKHVQRLRRADYPTREYIVQYRETDLEFVLRLMAEEGIWHCFEHGEDGDQGELLVLLDANDDALEADFGEDGDELPMQLGHDGTTYWQAVTEFSERTSVAPTSLSIREYNWTNPDVPEQKSLPSEEPGERPRYEPYDVTFWGYADKKFAKFDTEVQARLRWELVQGLAAEARGQGNVIGLMPGQKVSVRGVSQELDGDWLVLSVQAGGRDARNTEHAVSHLEDYSNSFRCRRMTLPYRPPRRRPPRVYGIQSARVVGPDGKPEVAAGADDIHTDEHGRIQVKLAWDRSEPGANDTTVTCFLRVAQNWAGNGWGFMFVPRIGMEVIVSFLDGDPSQPLVTGCVYNGLNRPHYEQPAEKTKSYIKTQSSPSGKGFNELCFEDADGKERIYVHAQRDFDEVVEHDHSTLVHENQKNTVDKSQSESIGGSQSLTVGGKRTKEVGGSGDSGEQNTIHGDRKTTISKDEVLEVGEQQKHTVGKGREVTVSTGDDNCTVSDGHKTTKVSKKYTQKSQDQFAIAQGSGEQTKFVLNDSVYVQTQGDVQLKNDQVKIYGASGGKLQLQASQEIKLVCGASSISMKSDGTIELVGLKVSAGTSTNNLKCDPAGTTLGGLKVSIMGQTQTQVSGAVIKIGC